MKKIKAVIFDLDGTLGNTIPLCIEAFRKSVEPILQRSISDEEIKSTFGPDEEGSIKVLVPKEYKKATSDFMHFYEHMHHICPDPFDGISDVLQALQAKGVTLTMATGKGKYTTELTLRRFNLAQYFSIIETGSPDGSRKPEAISQIIQSLPGIERDEVVYVGDSPGDIRDSRKAGIAVVAAAWADTANVEKLKEKEPDALFTSLDDFKSWILSKV